MRVFHHDGTAGTCFFMMSRSEPFCLPVLMEIRRLCMEKGPLDGQVGTWEGRWGLEP